MSVAPRPVSRVGRGRAGTVPYVFLAPFLILFVLFALLAMFGSLALSFTNWQGVAGGSWVGLGNYERLIGDESFRRAVRNTALIWILTVPLLSFGSLAIAWILESKLVPLRRVFRTLYFLPVLPSLVVVGITFLLLLDPQYGLPNIALQKLGLPVLNIKTDSAAAVPVLSLVIIWRWLGFNIIIQLAGLQSISRDIVESARMDRANEWQLFWRIIVPMSKPVLIFAFINSTIGTFNLFDEAYMLFGTQGGPSESGLVVGTLLFRQAFEFFDLGYASAIAYAVAIMVFVVSLIQLRWASRGE